MGALPAGDTQLGGGVPRAVVWPRLAGQRVCPRLRTCHENTRQRPRTRRRGAAFGNCAVQGDSRDRVSVLLQWYEQGPAFGIAGAQGGAPPPQETVFARSSWVSDALKQLLGFVGFLSLPRVSGKGQGVRLQDFKQEGVRSPPPCSREPAHSS